MPDPLHPALVHLPIGLAVVAPIAAIAIAWSIRSRALPARAWFAMIALQSVLTLGGWAAFEAGEDEEERVERVVGERLIEAHEEAAERFLLAAVATLIVSAGGLATGRRGTIGRSLTVIGSAVTLAASVSAGHLGGELVYVHGAADAYTGSEQGAGGAANHPIDDEHSSYRGSDAGRARRNDD